MATKMATKKLAFSSTFRNVYNHISILGVIYCNPMSSNPYDKKRTTKTRKNSQKLAI